MFFFSFFKIFFRWPALTTCPGHLESVVCVFAKFVLGVFAVGPLQVEAEWVVAAEREQNIFQDVCNVVLLIKSK